MSRLHNMNGAHHTRSKWEDVPPQKYTPLKQKWEDPSRSFSSRYMSKVYNPYSSYNGLGLNDLRIGNTDLNGINHSQAVGTSGNNKQATSNPISLNQNKPRKASFKISLFFIIFKILQINFKHVYFIFKMIFMQKKVIVCGIEI